MIASGDHAIALGNALQVSGLHSVGLGLGTAGGQVKSNKQLAVMGGNVAIGDTKTVSTVSHDHLLQVYGDKNAVVSLKTKSQEYYLQAISSGQSTPAGLYIGNAAVPVSFLAVSSSGNVGVGASPSVSAFSVGQGSGGNAEIFMEGFDGPAVGFACVNNNGEIYRSSTTCDGSPIPTTELACPKGSKFLKEVDAGHSPDPSAFSCVDYQEYVDNGCSLAGVTTGEGGSYKVYFVDKNQIANYPHNCSGG